MLDAESVTAMKTALDRALELHEYGLAPIPIVPGTKRPAVRIKPFFEQGPSPRQFPILFCAPVEIAVLCGQPSDRLVILDCDNMRSAQRLLSLLGDPATWLVRTARGLHIYLRTPVAVKSARGDGYDLQAQFKYCLAPGSRHPQGMFYEFVRRTPHILELPALDAVPELGLEPARLRPPQIPRRAWHLLTDENEWQAGYASRSEAECAILIALVNTGHSYERALSLFTEHAHRDTHFKNLIRDRGVSAAEGWLRRSYERAADYACTHSNPELESIRRARRWVLEQAWPGHSGAYDRAVLLGHIEIAERAGRLTYQADVRDLAEHTGISIKGVSRANGRLVRKRLIGLERKGMGMLAAIWKLDVSGASKGNTPTEPTCEGVCHFDGEETAVSPGLPPDVLAHDVFRWAGLGKCAAHVWAILTSSPQAVTAPALAQATGRGNRTVERALERMRGLGMVRRDPGENGVLWSAVKGVNLDDIARMLGTSGMGVRQRAEHVRQRETHRARMRRRLPFEKPRP